MFYQCGLTLNPSPLISWYSNLGNQNSMKNYLYPSIFILYLLISTYFPFFHRVFNAFSVSKTNKVALSKAANAGKFLFVS